MVLPTGMMNQLHPHLSTKARLDPVPPTTRGEKILFGSAVAALMISGVSAGLLSEHFKAEADAQNQVTEKSDVRIHCVGAVVRDLPNVRDVTIFCPRR